MVYKWHHDILWGSRGISPNFEGYLYYFWSSLYGLHLIWENSFIYPINTVDEIENLASRLGGKVGEMPTTYLGMTLGTKSKSTRIWNVEKWTRILTNLKSQYLSRGGRLILINSKPDTLLSYLMSIFPILASVSKRIDALRRNFFRQGKEDKKKYHLANSLLYLNLETYIQIEWCQLSTMLYRLKWKVCQINWKKMSHYSRKISRWWII